MTRLKLCILFMSFVFFVQSLSAQNSPYQDSLLNILESQKDSAKVETLIHLFNAFKRQNLETSKQYIQEAVQLGEKLELNRNLAIAYFSLGSHLRYLQQSDSAHYYLDKAIDFTKKNKHYKILSSSYTSKSDIYRLAGQYQKAIDLIDSSIYVSELANDTLEVGIAQTFKSSIYRNLGNYLIAYELELKALKNYEALGNQPLRVADSYKTFGEIEFQRDNIEEAIINYKKALTVYQAEKDHYYYALTLNRIANSYLAGNNLDSAKVYIDKALTITKEKDFKTPYHVALIIEGTLHHKKGAHEQAVTKLKETLKVSRGNNNINSIYSQLLLLGISSSELGQYNAAESYFDEGLLIADTINAPRETQEFLEARAKMNARRGFFKNAYDDNAIALQLKDSLAQVNNDKIIEEWRTVYDTEKKEKQILKQETDILLLTQKEKINQQRLMFLILGILSLLALSSTIIYGLRQKRKKDLLERKNLQSSLEFKTKQLTTHVMHLAQKNEVLLNLKEQIEEVKKDSDKTRKYQSIINSININVNNDEHWKEFMKYFEEIHKDFHTKSLTQFPKINANDLRLMSLLRMNLNSKEIANILNISPDGVKKARYRLRKKLSLETEQSLEQIVMSI